MAPRKIQSVRFRWALNYCTILKQTGRRTEYSKPRVPPKHRLAKMRISPGTSYSGQCNGDVIVKEGNRGRREIEGILMGWLRGHQRRLGSPEEHARHQGRSGVGLSYPHREPPLPTSDGPRGSAETPGLQETFLGPARPLPGQPRITRRRPHGPSEVPETPGEWKGQARRPLMT